MDASVILKCCGASFPVGFSTSRIWRLTPSFMVLPPVDLAVVDAVGAQETRRLVRGFGIPALVAPLCVASEANRRTRIPQREHRGIPHQCSGFDMHSPPGPSLLGECRIQSFTSGSSVLRRPRNLPNSARGF